MNELKLMAIKAKSRLLNKGLREIYSSVSIENQNQNDKNISQATLFLTEENRKKELLNRIKLRID